MGRKIKRKISKIVGLTSFLDNIIINQYTIAESQNFVNHTQRRIYSSEVGTVVQGFDFSLQLHILQA